MSSKIDKKFFLANVLTIFIGITMFVLLFLCLEGFVRLLFPIRPALDISHPILNHMWRPNFSWKDKNGNICYHNKQGWIETYDVSKRKPNDVYRIFYVGDSNTQGPLPMDTSLPSQVESLLTEPMQKKGWSLEVVNTGTSSYSPMLYYILIKDYILPYSPDLVVINVDMTDVFDDFLYRDTAVYNAAGELIACPPGHNLKGRYVRTEDGLVKLSAKGQIYNFFKSHSVLFNYMRLYLLKTIKTKNKSGKKTVTTETAKSITHPGLFDWCYDPWSRETENNVHLLMERLRAILTLLKSKHIKVAVTAVPHLPHFIPHATRGQFSLRPFTAVESVCRAEGIPYIDSYNGLLQKIGEENAANYYRENIHFNQKGYYLWARVQAEALMDSQNGLLPLE